MGGAHAVGSRGGVRPPLSGRLHTRNTDQSSTSVNGAGRPRATSPSQPTLILAGVERSISENKRKNRDGFEDYGVPNRKLATNHRAFLAPRERSLFAGESLSDGYERGTKKGAEEADLAQMRVVLRCLAGSLCRAQQPIFLLLLADQSRLPHSKVRIKGPTAPVEFKRVPLFGTLTD